LLRSLLTHKITRYVFIILNLWVEEGKNYLER
jgi:hypothetical protein